MSATLTAAASPSEASPSPSEGPSPSEASPSPSEGQSPSEASPSPSETSPSDGPSPSESGSSPEPAHPLAGPLPYYCNAPTTRFFIEASAAADSFYYPYVNAGPLSPGGSGPANTRFDAGIDVPLPHDICVCPGQHVVVGLGVRARCLYYTWDYSGARPPVCTPTAFFIVPRSSMFTADRPLLLVNSPGLVDPGYVGELKASLYNVGKETVQVGRGTALVQLVSMSGNPAEYTKVPAGSPSAAYMFSPTARGCGGFGSTG